MIALQPAIKFNGGGHLNHSIFWEVLCKNGTSEPTGKFSLKNLFFIQKKRRNDYELFGGIKGELAEAIKRDFGSYQNMIQLLTQQSVAIQGSGWGKIENILFDLI